MATRSFACGKSAASITTGSDPYSPFCPGMSVVPPPGQRRHVVRGGESDRVAAAIASPRACE